MRKSAAPLAVVVAAIGVWAIGCLAIYTSQPSWVSPYLLAVIVPALWLAFGLSTIELGSIVLFVSSVPIACLYILWSAHLFRASAILPVRSIALLALLMLLTMWGAYVSWPYGLKYQTREYTLYLDIAALVALTGLIALAVWTRRAPSFAKNFAFHTALFAWIAWGALPWLGELP